MSEILGDKLNIVYEGTLLEITPELMKKTIIKQNEEIERLNKELDKTRLSELDKEYKLNQVREYIDKAELGEDTEGDIVYLKDDLCGVELLEILDKVDKGE